VFLIEFAHEMRQQLFTPREVHHIHHTGSDTSPGRANPASKFKKKNQINLLQWL
jgi:hypothetical protein